MSSKPYGQELVLSFHEVPKDFFDVKVIEKVAKGSGEAMTKDELLIEIAHQKLLIHSLGMGNSFSDPEAYLEQARRYTEAILKLGEIQKEYEDAAKS